MANEGSCAHDCSSCGASCSSRTGKPPIKDTDNPGGAAGGAAGRQTAPSGIETIERPGVKNVIGVASGKGGVGKSMVCSLLAVMFNRLGYKTAVLDADVTGPSIPRIFGLRAEVRGSDGGMIPPETKTGIKVMSVNLLLDDERTPVVWRGPVIAGTVKQFWGDVAWGEVDYMFIDMPPGTGDVPLTVFQSLPVDGVVVVTTPQELVSMIVAKAVKMADMMSVPVLGVIENMSRAKCPECGHEFSVFAVGGGADNLGEAGLGAEILARLPLDPRLAALCDRGMIELADTGYLEEAAAIIDKKMS